MDTTETTETTTEQTQQQPKQTETPKADSIDYDRIAKLVDRETPATDNSELVRQLNELKGVVSELAASNKPQHNSSQEDFMQELKVMFDPNADPEAAKQAFVKFGKMAGRPEDELMQALGNTQQTTQEEPAHEEDPNDVYVRQMMKDQIAATRRQHVENLIEGDKQLKAILDLKKEIDGDEAAVAARDKFSKAVQARTTRLLESKWAEQPGNAPFKMEWIDQAAKDAYTSEVELLRTVVVDPSRVSRRTPDAVGESSILDADPVKAPDEALLKSGKPADRAEYLKQGEAYLKDRARREHVQRVQSMQKGSRA